MISDLLDYYVLNVCYWEDLSVWIADKPIITNEGIRYTTTFINREEYSFITEYEGTKLYKRLIL